MSKAVIVEKFEVLQWAWHLARKYDCPQEFRNHLKNIMTTIAEKGDIDFHQLLEELKRGDW